MGLVVLGERETSAQILLEERGLVSLDILDECAIDGFLKSNAISRWGLLLGCSLSKESLSISLLGLVISSESLVGDSRDINAGEADFGAGRNSVDLVNALKGHAVHFVWASNEKKATWKLLKEDNALSSESARKKDKDAASFNASAELGGLSFLCSDLSLLILCGVPLELFDH